MIWNEILCLGDSITFGARDPYKRSYPVELSKILTEKLNECYVCHNCSVSGETSSELLRRAWSNIKSHSNAKIMLLLIGTNDTQLKVPIDIYEDNLRQIISMARIHGMHVIVSTLPELAFTPLYLNRSYIKKYNDVINKLSQKMDFTLCDISGVENYYLDGVHLTHEGNKQLAHKFANTIIGL